MLIVCWFLPAWLAKTDYIMSFMRISTMVQEHAPNLTADVTIVCVIYSWGVLEYAF